MPKAKRKNPTKLLMRLVESESMLRDYMVLS